MDLKSRKSALRTIDVARAAGYSVQQVRDLESDGVLPPTTRTAAGYRTYGRRHVHAALAYRAFVAGIGPVEAKRVMRAAHHQPPNELLALLDAAHAQLHRERGALRLAQEATAAISAESIGTPRPSDSMSISELAGALGIRPSTLRHWQAEGLVLPDQPGPQRARNYSPRDVRDARVVHELRQAGYRIPTLRELMPQLRGAQRWDEVARALAARAETLNVRSQRLLDGAAALQDLRGT